jgi:glycosyltransferase involved in cell wall biosynthesis
MNISVIVTTYNWPEALHVVLTSLQQQTQMPHEILIADDGSDQRTRNVLTQFSSTLPLQHIWHEDKGFRAAKIRNKAVANATGDYLVFIDGDCLIPEFFIARQRALAETSYMVSGNRILCSQDFTPKVLAQPELLLDASVSDFLRTRLKKEINRLSPLLYVPGHRWRKQQTQRWQGCKTCNFACFRDDFLAVNGFNEAFSGWGYEDSDLVIRMMHRGTKMKQGRFALPVFHLWHQEAARDQRESNWQRLQETLEGDGFWVENGVDQYLLNN